MSYKYVKYLLVGSKDCFKPYFNNIHSICGGICFTD